MGHPTMTITPDTYSHFVSRHGNQHMRAIEAALEEDTSEEKGEIVAYGGQRV